MFSALEILVNDSKALYRRCQALEQLGKLEEAFKDIHTLSRLEPKVLKIIISMIIIVIIIIEATHYDNHHHYHNIIGT